MTKRKFTSILKQIQSEDLKTFEAKNADYGDSFRMFGAVGLLTRIIDKIARAMHISNTAVSVNVDEKLEDTIKDLRIYCLMFEGLRREQAQKVLDKELNEFQEAFNRREQ